MVFVLFEIILENIYLRALSIFTVFLILSKAVLILLTRYINQNMRRLKPERAGTLIAKIEYPLSWIIIFLGASIALNNINMQGTIIIRLIYSFLLVTAMHTVNMVMDHITLIWEDKWRAHAASDEALFTLVHNTGKIITITISIIILLFIWGLKRDELKNILLSLSVLGVIIGFALKDTLSNIISGISVVTDHAFKVNDMIKLETGEMGFVTHIGLRSTKLRTFDNEIITIPNSVLANTKVLNYAQTENGSRIVMPVGVEYGSDPEKVKKVLLSVLDGNKYVSDPRKNEVRFVEMADFAIRFELIFFIHNYKDKLTVKSKVNGEIYKALRKNDIGIPYPTRTVYMQNGKRNNKGDQRKRK